MLRLYKRFAKQMLLILLYTRDRVNRDMVIDHIYNRWRQVPPPEWLIPLRDGEIDNRAEVAELVGHMISREDFFTGDAPFNEMINSLVEQLSDDRNEGGDGKTDRDLIDTIVRCLQLPFSQNVLSGKVLNRLRQAILLPGEVAAFSESVKAREMACSGCGHPFANGEMLTYMAGGMFTNGGLNTLVCSRCRVPTAVPCSNKGCTYCIAVNKGLAKALGRTNVCAVCAEAGTAEPRVEEGGVEPQLRRYTVLTEMPGGMVQPTGGAIDFTDHDQRVIGTAAANTIRENELLQWANTLTPNVPPLTRPVPPRFRR